MEDRESENERVGRENERVIKREKEKKKKKKT